MVKPKLLAVLEPYAFHDSLCEAEKDINCVEVELESEWIDKALACEGRRGFIHAPPDHEESSNRRFVLVHESVGVR